MHEACSRKLGSLLLCLDGKTVSDSDLSHHSDRFHLDRASLLCTKIAKTDRTLLT